MGVSGRHVALFWHFFVGACQTQRRQVVHRVQILWQYLERDKRATSERGSDRAIGDLTRGPRTKLLRVGLQGSVIACLYVYLEGALWNYELVILTQ